MVNIRSLPVTSGFDNYQHTLHGRQGGVMGFVSVSRWNPGYHINV